MCMHRHCRLLTFFYPASHGLSYNILVTAVNVNYTYVTDPDKRY
jgi:hypothetical protein